MDGNSTSSQCDSKFKIEEPNNESLTTETKKYARIIIVPKPEWQLMDIVTKAVPPGWNKVFEECLPEFEVVASVLNEKIQDGEIYFPLKRDLFRAFQYCPLDRVRVVIIGQDPYHSTNLGNPVANGMAFSVNKGESIPPSLRNIYKEIARDYPTFRIPNHGDLTGWARQGVFLLNTCLTVKPHIAGSHKTFWLPVIKKVIEAINQANPRCIYVLWGAKAQKMEEFIRGKSIILKSSHPSPFSYSRGFYGCKHFSTINQILTEMNQREIDWQI